MTSSKGRVEASKARRALREAAREKRRSETGSLMHKRDDPKNDRLCCLQSSGLCRNLGSKHHRKNKKCWLYPQTCSHCLSVQLRAEGDDAGMDAEERRIPLSVSGRSKSFSSSTPEPAIKAEQMDVDTKTLPRHAGNSSPSTGDSPLQVMATMCSALNLGPGGSPGQSEVVESIENDVEEYYGGRKQFIKEEVTEPDMLKDARERRARSWAPSPELEVGIPGREASSSMGSGESKRRDPRLALGYVLATR
ncbi:hypothetical protein LTS08_006246 [Lithohypha guttulata]|nr:hypothetical protein LTS08_006246 [Lithohypha guttulata]